MATGPEFEFTVEQWNSAPQHIQFWIRHKPEAPTIQEYLLKFQPYFSSFLKEKILPVYGIAIVNLLVKIEEPKEAFNRRLFQPTSFQLDSEEKIPLQSEAICSYLNTKLSPYVGSRVALMRVEIVPKLITNETWMNPEFQLDAEAHAHLASMASYFGLDEHLTDVIALADFLRLRFLDAATPISKGANHYLTQCIQLRSQKIYTQFLIAACTAITRKKCSGLRLIAWFHYKGQPLREMATLEHYYRDMWCIRGKPLKIDN